MRKLALLVGACAATTLCAQSPSPSPTASPAPSSSPAPTMSPSATPSPSPTPPPLPPSLSLRETIKALPDAEVTKAVSALREKFVDPARVSDPSVQRATLEGLVRQLAPGAVLIDTTRAHPTPEETVFLSEILNDNVGYLRLGKLDDKIDDALKLFADKKVDAVVLDLRGVSAGGSFETAAEIARRFTPKGRQLFSVQKPSAKQEHIFSSTEDPRLKAILIVLTDSDTSGAAEALAAALRQSAGAMIIGSDTTGAAAEFTDVALGNGTILRVAIAQAVIPGIGPLFPGGLKPDVPISLPIEVQEQIFRESKDKGMSQFILESDRHRMNEASLVANQNPEIDAAQSYQREKGRPPALRDTVLQRALDLVTAIDFYKAKQHP